MPSRLEKHMKWNFSYCISKAETLVRKVLIKKSHVCETARAGMMAGADQEGMQ